MKLKSALLVITVAIGFHIYLALHYYQLNFGMLTSESLCNVNDLFNCDAVTASSYSAVFGIPIALWGAVTNSVLALLIMSWVLGWSDDITRLGRYTLWLSGLIAGVSLLMGTISTLMIGSYCLFCMGTYIASFVAFFLILKSQESDARPSSQYLSEIFGGGKTFLYFLIAIPLLTIFFHYSYTSKVGAGEMDKVVRLAIADWETSSTVDLSQATPSFIKGSQNPKMTIEEFADFRCSHCKHAGPSINAFLNSHNDVTLKFYTFPLDGACNEFMPPGGGDGISCYLAKNVFCAEKVAQKGNPTHDAVFSMQENINKNGMDYAKEQVAEILNTLNIPSEEQKVCVESPETDTVIRAQAQAASAAGLKGTPFFIVNGKALKSGQLLPVLEGVYQKLK